jgi:hypothetical protein
MAAKGRLAEIVDAMEMQSEESLAFFDPETGAVEVVSRELCGKFEDGATEIPGLPAWQKKEWETVQRVLSSGSWVRLPRQFDIHDSEIMREFADSIESRPVREELQYAIQGPGAFRMFKSAIRRRKVEDDWHAFRNEALRKIAREWCEENDIECE